MILSRIVDWTDRNTCVLFADGAGTYDVIASLPLASGYSTSFRNFDVMKQKPQLKQLKVIG